ncbi:methionine synthase I (cobalamin-dependent) [Oikeobacillus pervagus]|uniref:Methionine synthase I (Cobalamin-dependent) n=1 Tax=Oikeobacillus pervagus TaxID=1325931 RepID=A0AAJ1SWM7_9BACI|nr:homocysteine S-methyltransferase family protein [Oikeobacillus pervagus]MDQ0213974.1 methionine synthase I (cobalamin-dependent) [Oikeobacillus pervagus]
MIFTNTLSKEIVIIDGAMGTELWKSLDLPYKKPFSAPSLNISNPEIVEEIHTRYLHAGADVITTNTFTANLLLQTYYGKESEISEQNEKECKLQNMP